MKKVFFVVSGKEELATKMPTILSQGNNKVIYIDERLKDTADCSNINSGKYSISLSSKSSIGFYRATLIIEKSKRNEIAVYLGTPGDEIAVYIILA